MIAILGSGSKVGIGLSSDGARDSIYISKNTVGTAAVHSVSSHGNIVRGGSPGKINLGFRDNGGGKVCGNARRSGVSHRSALCGSADLIACV